MDVHLEGGHVELLGAVAIHLCCWRISPFRPSFLPSFHAGERRNFTQSFPELITPLPGFVGSPGAPRRLDPCCLLLTNTLSKCCSLSQLCRGSSASPHHTSLLHMFEPWCDTLPRAGPGLRLHHTGGESISLSWERRSHKHCSVPCVVCLDTADTHTSPPKKQAQKTHTNKGKTVRVISGSKRLGLSPRPAKGHIV